MPAARVPSRRRSCRGSSAARRRAGAQGRPRPWLPSRRSSTCEPGGGGEGADTSGAVRAAGSIGTKDGSDSVDLGGGISTTSAPDRLLRMRHLFEQYFAFARAAVNLVPQVQVISGIERLPAAGLCAQRLIGGRKST